MHRTGSNDPDPRRALATVTHARIRLRQGDVGTARRILDSVIAVRPEDAEARALLAEIGGRKSAPRVPVHAPRSGTEADPRRVVEHLSGWLDRIKRNAGAGGV